MIGRMIAPASQTMLLCRPKFKFRRFQMTVNKQRRMAQLAAETSKQ
jgi:hypothetical protein